MSQSDGTLGTVAIARLELRKTSLLFSVSGHTQPSFDLLRPAPTLFLIQQCSVFRPGRVSQIVKTRGSVFDYWLRLSNGQILFSARSFQGQGFQSNFHRLVRQLVSDCSRSCATKKNGVHKKHRAPPSKTGWSNMPSSPTRAKHAAPRSSFRESQVSISN